MHRFQSKEHFAPVRIQQHHASAPRHSGGVPSMRCKSCRSRQNRQTKFFSEIKLQTFKKKTSSRKISPWVPFCSVLDERGEEGGETSNMLRGGGDESNGLVGCPRPTGARQTFGNTITKELNRHLLFLEVFGETGDRSADLTSVEIFEKNNCFIKSAVEN